jgi:phage terminase large subunit
MDEATQFTEREFRYLGACLRGVRDIPKRFYITCNPGGIGHRWVKRLFIDKAFRTGSVNPEENEDPADYTFIFATVEDNTHLRKSSPAYVNMLSSLPEGLRRAYRYGDWDALSGAYFNEFRSDTHVIRPFPIPDSWARYRSIDYGLDMLACLWTAIDPSGRCYVYRELKISGLIVSEAARTVLESTLPGERIITTFAPPDIWSRQKDTGRSMSELFASCGVPLLRSDSGRVQGHLMIKEMLMHRSDGQPGLLVFDICRELIGDLQAIQADEANPSDCAVQPHEITHTVDALRYFCISRTGPASEQSADDSRTAAYHSFMTGGALEAGYIGY